MTEIPKVKPTQAEYFPKLKTIRNPPLQLWVRGAMGIQSIAPDAFHLATIGSRDANSEALKAMDTFLLDVFGVFHQYIADQSLVVISGLAEGMDGQAHLTALNADVPTTGVLFTPANRFYPASNIHIGGRILANQKPGNVIISEHAPIPDNQATPKDAEAPKRRNRIITGISEAVLVAGVHSTASGTKNAVRQAYEQGRPIYAISTTLAPAVERLFVGGFGAKMVRSAKELFDDLATK
jgi:DNA processing protein